MADEVLVSNLVAKLDYLSKWMPDIWLALKQKGQDMSDKDIALIGQKIRGIRGGGSSGLESYIPTCYFYDTDWDVSTAVSAKTNEDSLYQMPHIETSIVPIVEVEYKGD